MTNSEGRMLFSAGAMLATIAAAGVSVVGDPALPGRSANPTTAVMAAGVATSETLSASLGAAANDVLVASTEAAAPASVAKATPRPVTRLSDAEERRLAAEIARLKARDAAQLVSVVTAAWEETQPEIPLTFLLAIAYNETHGKVLAVSPAGAAGLAQATPAAYLAQPGFEGRLFITNNYLVGARSYIMKKPLGDAMSIAELLMDSPSSTSRERARALLTSAREVQREGMDELHVLEPHAPALFARRIDQADAYNSRALDELETLIDRGAPRDEVKRYHERVKKQYRAMMDSQQRSWTAYQKELEQERDRLLRKRFGGDPVKIIRSRAYEAGEYLAENLDIRFSPTTSARFLAAHLETKQQQARDLGLPLERLDEWTAALYNGGSVNIRRMHAGLMGSLVETERYMKKIPSLSNRLSSTIS